MKEEVSIQNISLAYRWPLPDRAQVKQESERVRKTFHRKIVVLDDDPTGVQTIHDRYVYTDWEQDTFVQGLKAEENIFFILTNSRGLSAEQTKKVHRQIGIHLAQAAKKTGQPFLLVSRSDSTLRGHYPLETEVLRQVLEEELPVRYSGEIIMPYFREGGRLTIEDVHYIRDEDTLIPVGQTEFARDTTFGYQASNLKQWCEERTAGAYPASKICSISLQELRKRDYASICNKLRGVEGFEKIVVNAADDVDVCVFVTALLQVIEEGKEFLFRSAAGLLPILSGMENKPLLSNSEMTRLTEGNGGLIVVGSHVEKTTKQLNYLLDREPEVKAICFHVNCVLNEEELQDEKKKVLQEVESALSQRKTVVLYTSRQVLRVSQQSDDRNLHLSVEISHALSDVIAQLRIPPKYLIAKGGITSSEIGVQGLKVKKALVLGQIVPGVPVWRTGAESRFPGLTYVVFPGNVGDTCTLLDVVRKLQDKPYDG